MTPELKAAWARALRSGEYKQGIGSLKQMTSAETSFCCLGVLAVVAGLKIQDDGLAIEGDCCNGGYPSLERLGLRVSTDRYVINNDTDCMIFGEIADFVEANE